MLWSVASSIVSRRLLRDSTSVRRSPVLFRRSLRNAGGVASISNQSAFRRTRCGLCIYPLPKSFSKVLIANRGEIACRVIRTCKELGIRTVAVYSDVDRDCEHASLADEAYRLGERHATDTYLRMDKILDIAVKSRSEAIHPGYGFLSENPAFVKLIESTPVDYATPTGRIEFLGPPSTAMVAMGDKAESKRIMEAANVPCVPGFHGSDQSDDRLFEEASKIGFEGGVMIKAVAGGGGRGMRPVFAADDFLTQLNQARVEAMSFFGNSDVLLEKIVTNSRHIEFQVFADKHGNGVHFFERDCSVQRANQKIFEEVPAPFLSEELRNAMGDAAVRAALACGYVGAGTVEFLFDPVTQQYYFMEMNTRLQVEHCVSEICTDRDLVQLQLHVGANHALPVSQSDLSIKGFGIEARIYAEDPSKGFSGCAGTLNHLRFPIVEDSEHMRVETALREGDEITSNYDPMIAKLVVHSDSSREDMLNQMRNALDAFQVSGITTNIEFLKTVLSDEDFRKGGVEIDYVKRNFDRLMQSMNDSLKPTRSKAIVAAVLTKVMKNFEGYNQMNHGNSNLSRPAWMNNAEELVGFNPTGQSSWDVSLQVSETGATVDCRIVFENDNNVTVQILGENSGDVEQQSSLKNKKSGKKPMLSKFDRPIDEEYQFTRVELVDSRSIRLISEECQSEYCSVYDSDARKATVFVDGHRHDFDFGDIVLKYKGDFQPTLDGWTTGDLSLLGAPVQQVQSPIDCDVLKVFVNENDMVQKGDPLVELTAMKKINTVLASMDGKVSKIMVKEGTHVSGGQVLLSLEEPSSE